MADALHLDYGPGRFGRGDGPPGLVLQEYTQFSLASVVARRNQAERAAAAALQACGTAPPTIPAITTSGDLAFLWSGPGHWLALEPQGTEPVEARFGAVFGSQASVFDQSGSRVLLELRGPRVREVLAKGVSIDLHPRAFKTGDARGHHGVASRRAPLASHRRTGLSSAGRAHVLRQPLALARRFRGRRRL